ncbi:hypothetical protein [Clostridium botulinum]|uniref:hypothetical protein n=1 Tax=Clostridium botulinum TaxID=1491 RepID=UPI003DA3F088
MSNTSYKSNIFNKFKNFLERWYYFSPSLFYYKTVELNEKKYDEIKKKAREYDKLRKKVEESSEAKKTSEKLRVIKKNISQIMKYFFYFIDLVIISFILVKNTIRILKTEVRCDKIFYVSITSIVIFITLYCLHKINEYVKNNDNNSKDLIEKIIEFNEYNKNGIKSKMIKFSLTKTLLIGIIMVIIGVMALRNKNIELGVAILAIYYFIMRSVHYCIVFYRDFKKKTSYREVKSSNEKMRYITLALLNYVKIILEFSILIYVLKYMGWAFVNIRINTFFELVHLIVAGKLEVTSTIEIFINLLRIVTLGMVITLNLATYMALENKNIDNSMKA